MGKLFKCCRKKAADKVKATFTFTIDERGFTHLDYHCDEPDGAVETKLHTQCLKLQMEMLNFQSRLLAQMMGDGE